MSTKPVSIGPSISAWKAQGLRLTAFPSESFAMPEPSWWLNLLGDVPESRSAKLKESIIKEEGNFEKGKLSLVTSPIKIDWAYGIANDQGLTEGILSIGSFLNSLDPFLSLMHRWLREMCPPIKRLAFGAVLIHPVEDHSSGYQLLAAYLPHVQIDPVGSTDFTYRINRPRDSKSGLEGLKINRLCSWSVMATRTQFFVGPSTIIEEDIGLRASRLELDINTAQDYQNRLPHNKLPDIFYELVDLGKEIADKGDIR